MEKTLYRIGFVGVGRMGANIARCLKEKGYSVVVVQDVNSSAATTLAQELKCEAAKDPAGVAEIADTIFTVVTDDQAMRGIYAEGEDFTSLLAHATWAVVY